jgi:hypothetical protein
MNIHWKIFNVLNLICLTLVTGFFVLPIIQHPYPVNDLLDTFFYVITGFVMLIVIINCLHNIFLTRLLDSTQKLTATRKVFYWILLLLFMIVILVFAYSFVEHLATVFTQTGAYQSYFKPRLFTESLSVTVTGFYIIVMQIKLFRKIKNHSRQELDDSIDEIGTE